LSPFSFDKSYKHSISTKKYRFNRSIKVANIFGLRKFFGDAKIGNFDVVIGAKVYNYAKGITLKN